MLNNGINSALYILVTLLLLCSCTKENRFDCVKGRGETITETRSISTFNKIALYDNIHLEIKQDTLNRIEIKAGSNLMPLIYTSVENGVLTIKNKNTCNWTRSFKEPVTATLYCINLEHINYYGSGNISSVNTLKTDTFSIYSWEGMGSINLNIEAEKTFFALHTGAADITAKGKTGLSYVYNGGYGWLFLSDLHSELAFARNAGTGDIFLTAHTSLEAEISGAGNINYKGSPQVLSKISGKGKLIGQ